MAKLKTQLKNVVIPPATFLFKHIEKFLVTKDMPVRFAPVFIVGSPRSGSTLLYQAITQHFKVCFFSNLMMMFSECPIFISKILAPLNGCNPPLFFKSQYGFTDGWNSPNQGLKFWDRFFPGNYGYVPPEDLSEQTKKEIRNTVASIQHWFEAPFINKCQPLSERLLAITEILPEALFVRIKRDPRFIAQSILNGKRALWNDENRWFSTRPRNYDKIKDGDYLETICKQIFHLEKDLDSDIEIIGSDKCITIHYEELCRSPRMIMDNINRFYSNNKNDFTLEIRNEIPLSFRNANNIKISAREFEGIENNFLELKKLSGAK